MDTRTTIVTVVEDAARMTPFCDCGAPMTAAEHEGDLWLECAERGRADGSRLSRLLSGRWLDAHDRRLLLHASALAHRALRRRHGSVPAAPGAAHGPRSTHRVRRRRAGDLTAAHDGYPERTGG